MGENYAKEVMKHAIGRACAALEIKYISEECIDVLSDVVKRYIDYVGTNTRDNAEISGRAYAGIRDLLPALETEGPIKTKWSDLQNFAFSKDEEGKNNWKQPFSLADMKEFPAEAPYQLGNQTENNGSKDIFIPDHLPAYPENHTYKKATTSSKKRVSSEDPSNTQTSSKKAKTNVTYTAKSARESLTTIELAQESNPSAN